MSDATPLLVERISRLDGPMLHSDRHGAIRPEVAHFVRTMETVTRPPAPQRDADAPVITAARADDLVAGCVLLQRLASRMPPVATGPLDTTRQYWIATGRPAHLPPRWPAPEPRRFVEPGPGMGLRWPPEFGLFTSTGFDGTRGMWWAYLELNRGSTLFPHPWTAWSVAVAPGARVVEISRAADWVDFVTSHPAEDSRGRLHPDWAAVALRWDAVHLSLRAIAAAQGLVFAAGDRLVDGPYWDVESTLWLRWAFTDTRRVHEEST